MNNLEKYVNLLMQAKEGKKEYTDMEKKYKPLVTKLLEENGITKDEIAGVKVSYQESTKSTIDEEKLVKIIQELSQCNPNILECLIPTYTVDENKLEELIYAGEISTDDLLPAYDSTTTKTLRMSRVK